MKKAFQIIALLLIILTSLLFIALRLSAAGAEDNYFNANWRSKFSRYPVMRGMLALHENGDAKNDYFGKSHDRIIIDVYSAEGAVSKSVLTSLISAVEKATGKQTDYRLAQAQILQRNFTDADIEAIEEKLTLTKNRGVAEMYLLVLGRHENEPNLLGLAHNEKGLIVFNDVLDLFTAYDPETFDAYQLSTILHEVGHQLGLPHNSQVGCLMNENAESDNRPKIDVREIVVDFCDYELDQIAAFRAVAE